MGLVGFESAPRYRELLYKLISEDLEFPPAGFILENDRPEWSFLKDELRFASSLISTVAVAAQTSFVQFFNPFNSGRLAVINKVMATVGGVVNFNDALTTTIRG